MSYRLLVCGSRNYPNKEKVHAYLTIMRGTHSDLLIITGMANGPDIWAYWFAQRYGIPCECYPAKWNEHGKRAGYVRNKEMIESKPNFVAAFWDGKSNGTKHTIDLAQKYHIPIEIIQ